VHHRVKVAKDDEQFVRFRPFERFLHGLVVISFLLLVATGMPLKFYDTGWAQTMVKLFGGLEVAGVLHRAGAIITFVYFGLHLASLGKAAIRNRARYRDPTTGRFSVRRFAGVVFGPDMPIPTLHDVREWWAHQKWFFGRGPRPDFDKWTYWEKFDYFAVFWGVTIIGLSGLVMWFPEEFSRVFPGWLINVALIVHSDEALLAAGFIFTFHFFNVHFRPEKFPMDPVIFSGRVTKAEMLHERKKWYERLLGEGRLDSIRVRDEWSQWKRVMHPLGFLAFGVGTILLLLIFYAMGSRLLGGGGPGCAGARTRQPPLPGVPRPAAHCDARAGRSADHGRGRRSARARRGRRAAPGPLPRPGSAGQQRARRAALHRLPRRLGHAAASARSCAGALRRVPRAVRRRLSPQRPRRSPRARRCRGPDVCELPRRPRHPAAAASRVAHLPLQHRADLRRLSPAARHRDRQRPRSQGARPRVSRQRPRQGAPRRRAAHVGGVLRLPRPS
jgi:cytochrome b subunit of formate dehydrogenase